MAHFLQMVRALSPQTEALLASADPFKIDHETLTLVIPYDFHRNKLDGPEARRIMEGVSRAFFDQSLAIIAITQKEARALWEGRA